MEELEFVRENNVFMGRDVEEKALTIHYGSVASNDLEDKESMPGTPTAWRG